MLYDVLVDRFDKGIVRDGLHEDGATVVPGGRGSVNLKRESAILLQHAMVNVLDTLEPGHVWIMDVVRFVVEDSELTDLAYDLAEINVAVSRLAGRLGTERREEVVAQIVVLKR